MQKWSGYWSPFLQSWMESLPGFAKKIMLWTRLSKKLFRNRWYFGFIIPIYSFCNPPLPSSSSKSQDLTRSLQNSVYENFHFDEKIDLRSHWKKNSGRYSGLGREKRWQNTQITFLKDPQTLHNHSLDSTLLTPNSRITFSLLSGKGTLRFHYGILSNNQSETEGSLKIFSGTTLLEDIPVKGKEKWIPFQKEFDLGSSLRFEWNSKESFLFLGAPEWTPKEYAPEGYNVIFIVVDSLRKDALGCNGQKLATSPNIDKLSEEGISFKNHFSNANWTKPSMISMFMGEYASNLGITNSGFPIYPLEKEIFYNQSIKSLPEVLRNKGYYTASIMNNVFLLDYTGVGVDLGFHELHQIGKDIEDTEVITRETINFIRNPPRLPFFLHINYNTPHGSYSPPDHSIWDLQNESNPKDWALTHPILKRYYGEVRYTDEQVGKLLQELKKTNLYDNTLILLTADHGDLFDELHTYAYNGVYGTKYGHGETHYDEEINIPLIIKIPRTIKNRIEKNIFHNPTSSISIYPTLLGLLGFRELIPIKTKGQDYSSHILENTEPISESPVYTEGRLSESIRTSKLKYIRRYPGFTNYLLAGAIPPPEKMEELYDLSVDPVEHKDIKRSNQTLYEKAQNLRKDFILQKNTFVLQLPAKHRFEGFFQLKGGIYDYTIPKGYTVKIGNRYNLYFSGYSETVENLEILTNEPDRRMEFSIKKDFLPTPVRLGPWGLLQRGNLAEFPDVISNPHDTPTISDFLPLLYSKDLLSGKSKQATEPILAEEVKSILKSWGYIHE